MGCGNAFYSSTPAESSLIFVSVDKEKDAEMMGHSVAQQEDYVKTD